MASSIRRRKASKKAIEKSLPLHLMIFTPMFLLLLFHFGSLFGLSMAFQNYLPGQGFYVFGSQFVGLSNFIKIFDNSEIWRILGNTVIISLEKIVIGTIVPIVIAILINEVANKYVKKSVQTLIFIPYFISWVILSVIFNRLFVADGGVVTTFFKSIGLNFPNLISDKRYFRLYVLLTALWKGAGYTTIIHLASITTIDPTLYEAAEIDGANRIDQCFHVTLPGMLPSIILMAVLNMGNILSAGFDQIYQLYSEMVYETGDILDTYIYRTAFEGAMDYGLSTATSLLKSIVSLIFVSASYLIAYYKFDYKVL